MYCLRTLTGVVAFFFIPATEVLTGIDVYNRGAKPWCEKVVSRSFNVALKITLQQYKNFWKASRWSRCDNICQVMTSMAWDGADENRYCFSYPQNWKGSYTRLRNCFDVGCFAWQTESCTQCLSLQPLQVLHVTPRHAIVNRKAISKKTYKGRFIKLQKYWNWISSPRAPNHSDDVIKTSKLRF